MQSSGAKNQQTGDILSKLGLLWGNGVIDVRLLKGLQEVSEIPHSLGHELLVIILLLFVRGPVVE
jgi:hypothetical protein